MSDRPVLAFKALQLANEHRNAYGLRYNDFTRYRKHCTNRTHRLRSSLKMTHGKGREFKQLPVVPTEKLKEGHLELLLFESERAWAHAQDLHAEARKTSDSARARTLRHSAAGRFRRSVHWATRLLDACRALHACAPSRLSAESMLHATAYALLVRGRFLRHREELEEALIKLSVARGLLGVLADGAVTSRDQALAGCVADEVAPEIRWCAHELGREKAYDVDSIVGEMWAAHRAAVVDGCEELLAEFAQEVKARGTGVGMKLKVLEWEGLPVPVRNPDLVDVLLKVQEAEAKLVVGHIETEPVDSGEKGKRKRRWKRARARKGVAAYDAILLALGDAEEVARKLSEALQSGGAAAGPGTRDIHFLHAYIVFHLLARRIQRDLVLLSALFSSQVVARSGAARQRVDARVFPAASKILDATLQSLAQMRTLSIVDDSPDLASAVDARIAFTKAKQCLYLAKCYAPLKMYAEALWLAQHAHIYVREARSSMLPDSDAINSADPAFYAIEEGAIDELSGDLTGSVAQLKQDWFAYNRGAVDAAVVTSKKTTFFDIADKYLQLDTDKQRERPDLGMQEEEEQEEEEQEEEGRPVTPEPAPAPARGLSALLSGWWGRG